MPYCSLLCLVKAPSKVMKGGVLFEGIRFHCWWIWARVVSCSGFSIFCEDSQWNSFSNRRFGTVDCGERSGWKPVDAEKFWPFFSKFHTHSLTLTYCWWTESCTNKDDDYPIIYGVLAIPGVAGFCPSTVAPENEWLEDEIPFEMT